MSLIALMTAMLLAQIDPGGLRANGYRSCSPTAIPDKTTIRAVGAFSNMRYTDEHAYGHSVHLWRTDDCMFGLFFASAGLAGDAPVGYLEEVWFRDFANEYWLIFRARLTMGVMAGNRELPPVPSRDVYEFHGQISGDGVLRGSVSHTNMVAPVIRPTDDMVGLLPSRDEAQMMIGAATFGEWREKAATLLKARGPRW